MLKFIKISFVLAILFENLNAQNHLNKTNLAIYCSCNPMKSSIIYISLRYIKTIDPDTFIGLTSLRSLYLNSNQILSIDSAAFTGLSSLRVLELSYNQISSIDPAAFTDLTSLRWLYLNSNQISSIHRWKRNRN